MATQPQQTDQATLLDRARRVLPGGGLGNYGPEVIIRDGRGGRVWDVDGKEYVDYIQGSGPMILGHAHPEVVAAVTEQLPHGSTFFTSNPAAIALAEVIVDATPCADKLRYVSSGTEATHYALRIARAHRGRDKILKFEGGFHGMGDYALQSMAPKQPGNFPQPVSDSAGIAHGVSDDVLIAPFNDADLAASLIREHADELAAVIVEPFQRLIPPVPGFLEALRAATQETGVVLVFDEVVTGFRFSYASAQGYYGVIPDLCAMGKTIGGGFPLAAVAGRDDIMAHFDASAVGPEQFAMQIGTLSGNPVAAVAGLKTLEILARPGAYEQIFETGRRLMQGLENSLAKAGVPARVMGEPPVFDVAFTDEKEVRDYRAVLRADAAKLKRFNTALLENGILKGDTKFYVGLAHGEAEVAQTLTAFDAAAAAVA